MQEEPSYLGFRNDAFFKVAEMRVDSEAFSLVSFKRPELRGMVLKVFVLMKIQKPSTCKFLSVHWHVSGSPKNLQIASQPSQAICSEKCLI
jgi:hypothetical protein